MPELLRNSHHLVSTGLSSAERETYSHKYSRPCAKLVVPHMTGKCFNTEIVQQSISELFQPHWCSEAGGVPNSLSSQQPGHAAGR